MKNEKAIRHKYQVWYFASTWEEGTQPYWSLALDTDDATAAFIKKVELLKQDREGEVKTTQLVDFKVEIRTDESV